MKNSLLGRFNISYLACCNGNEFYIMNILCGKLLVFLFDENTTVCFTYYIMWSLRTHILPGGGGTCL